MQRDERYGLIVLIVFLIVSTVLCSLTTGGGQAVSNIFSNLVNYGNDSLTPTLKAQFDSIEQRFSLYFLIGMVSTAIALLTLFAIALYALIRRRLARSWCVFLIITGTIAGSLVAIAQYTQYAIEAVPVPQSPYGVGPQISLLIETNGLASLGSFGGGLAFVGIILLAVSIIRQRRRGPQLP